MGGTRIATRPVLLIKRETGAYPQVFSLEAEGDALKTERKEGDGH